MNQQLPFAPPTERDSSANDEQLAIKRAQEALRLLADELDGAHVELLAPHATQAWSAATPEGELSGEWILDDPEEWQNAEHSLGQGRWEPTAPARHAQAAPEGPRGKELMQNLKANALAPSQAMTAWYQPQFTLAGELCGVEALLRWPRPEGGFYATAQIIPMAEAAGVLGTLDTWMMGLVAEQSMAWKRTGFLKDSGARVSLNVSQAELLSGAIERESVRLAQIGQLDPNLIELEIGESAVMERFDECARALERLSLMGFAIAMDDFGTGYISLAKMARLSINKIKVDRSITRSLPRQEEQLVVRMALGLAKEMGIAAVVEGVETSEQVLWLQGQNADALQGYWFSKPVSPERLEAFMSVSAIPARLRALRAGHGAALEGAVSDAAPNGV